MKRIVVAAAVLLLLAPSLAGQARGEDIKFAFATVQEGKQILTSRDEFVQRMSPFDRAARMKTDRDVSEDDYLAFVAANVLAWTDAEEQQIVAAIEGVRAELEARSMPLPDKVFFVKTTGREEAGAAYTRANAIVLPQAHLNSPVATLQKTICHELFHVMSRANAELREELYAAIGFVQCGEIAFPPELKTRKITNPDAPKNDSCVRLRVGGDEVWAVPILFSRSEKYDVERGGELFDYLQFRFLVVEWNDDSSAVTPVYEGQEPRLLEVNQVSEFFEQVGRNTGYIIHPEEILADNFALLVLQQRDVPSPAVIEKMEKILKKTMSEPP